MKTLIMKFGGAAFGSLSQFSRIADLIISKKNEFSRLVIVVSAMAQTTDQLINMALSIHQNPPQREYDLLISAGERISMTLLAMSLEKKGHAAVSFTGSQSGIITCKKHSNAQITGVKPYRLIRALDEGKVVIVAGFQGVSEDKEVTTLGRGGSDTTAVALGLALDAEVVEFYKDVNGIYDEDPKFFRSATNYVSLSYQAALAIIERGAKVLHARALHLAAKNGLPLHVRSFISSEESFGTYINDPNQIRKKEPHYEAI